MGKDYDNFINMMGYTDFENADINDTLFNYGLDDNIPGYKIVNVDYKKIFCIIGLETFNNNIDKLKVLYKDLFNDFLIR